MPLSGADMILVSISGASFSRLGASLAACNRLPVAKRSATCVNFIVVPPGSMLTGLLIGSMTIACADPVALSVSKKLDLIQSGKAKTGSVFRLTPAELNAWVRVKAPAIVQEVFRQPRLGLGHGWAGWS